MAEHDCVNAFKSGNKQVAEQLLPSIRPAVVRTTFESFYYGNVESVSLLHLAAYWGWKDVAICLVAVHKCVVNLRDDREIFRYTMPPTTEPTTVILRW